MQERELHVDEEGCVPKISEVSDNPRVPWTIIELRGTDQLYPPVTIEVLPNTVLLEMFSFYVDRLRDDADGWHTLVHVCRRWRFVVFDSPRRLNLRLLCTPKRPRNMLDIWPPLPIVIDFAISRRLTDIVNIIAALEQHCRVRKIHIRGSPNFLMEEFAAMKKPFPELTSLKLHSDDENVPILRDSFLGGSAPRLHTLKLYGIPFPAVRKLPLSSRNLVTLRLWFIPHSGYISPEAMVTCLSALTVLKSFDLGFRSPRVGGGTQHVPPLTRNVLAALTNFTFKGNSEYLEATVSLINTPLLDHFKISFFNQLIFDTPLLRHFISRTEIIKEHNRATVAFHTRRTEVRFLRKEGTTIHEGLFFLEIPCTPMDWQLSSLAQLCSLSLPPLYTLEHLNILSYRLHWQDDIETTQWLELLYPFTSVKHLFVSDGLVPLVAPALQELAGERVTELLPMLQNLSFKGLQQSKPVEEAIRQFIAARQLSGHPVAVLGHEV